MITFPRSRLVLAVALATAAVSAVACRAPTDDGDDSSGSAVSVDDKFYGNDRVGAVLKGHPEKIPATFEAFETTFGVGRSCARKDSKEIFVVEESQTRDDNSDSKTAKLLPRAVITGCNTGDLSNPATAKTSYSLFAALVSDPNMPDAAKGDTMRMWPLEVMALDETTGLYNWYVFEPAVTPASRETVVPPTAKGQVTRVHRAKAADSDKMTVMEQHLTGDKLASEIPSSSNRCFSCHVNGAPLMNEMRDPWTNWVSFKNTLPAASLGATTKALVSEAIPNATTSRSSLANDLEPIMRTAIQNYVFGAGPGQGWSFAVSTGAQPGGVGRLLSSVFCQTELNYGTASETAPIELWFDPDTIIGSDVTPPAAFGNAKQPFQLPIRSTFDQQTESWLVNESILSGSTVTAIRLLDDENDIFSTARCNLLPEIVKALPTDQKQVNAKVRSILTSKLATLPFAKTQPKRLAYLTALLGTTALGDDDTHQADYVTELTARFKAADKSDQAIASKTTARKNSAIRMFNTPANPLPLLNPN